MRPPSLILVFFIVGSIALQLAPFSGRALGQTMPAAIVAVIDYQRLMREATAANTIREQVEVRRTALQKDIAEFEQALHAEKSELEKQRTVLAAEAFQQQRKEFDEQVASVQRDVQERRQELDQLSAAALNEVRNAIIEVAGMMADEYGFNVVLPSSSVLLFTPELDLTDELLTRLNEKLPSVKVPFSAQ